MVWTEHCSQKKMGKNFLELVQKDFRYEPSSLVAVKGERLRVRNEDKAQHNSFALQRVGFDSGLQKTGTKYDVELTNPGLTKVFCRIHPKMVADVLVLPSPCYVEIHGEKEMASFSLPAPPKGNPGKAWLWSPNLKGFQRVSLKDGEPLEFFLDESMFLKKVEAATAGGDSYN